MTLPENTNPARIDQTNLSYRSANNTDDTTMPNTIGTLNHQDNNHSVLSTPPRSLALRAAPNQKKIYRKAAQERRLAEQERRLAEQERSLEQTTTRTAKRKLNLDSDSDSDSTSLFKRYKIVFNTGNQVTPANNADVSDDSGPTITLK